MVDKSLDDYPFWLWTMAVLATMLMPVSYAYAVVKDRVLDVPVLLKRSARYLIVQRGFVLGTVLQSCGNPAVHCAFYSFLSDSRQRSDSDNPKRRSGVWDRGSDSKLASCPAGHKED